MEIQFRHFAVAFVLATGLELAALVLWTASTPAPGVPGAGGRGQHGVRLSLRSAPAAPAPALPAPPAPSAPPRAVRSPASAPDVEAAPVAAVPPLPPARTARAVLPEAPAPAVSAGPLEAAAPAKGDAGSGVAAGLDGSRAGEGAASDGSGPDRTGLRDDYLGALWSKVHRQLSRRYPRRARRMGIEGTVVLGVELERSGELRSVTLRESSGSDELDRHARRTLERAAPFGPVPDAFEDVDLGFDFPLEYRLRDR